VKLVREVENDAVSFFAKTITFACLSQVFMVGISKALIELVRG